MADKKRGKDEVSLSMGDLFTEDDRKYIRDKFGLKK